MIEGNLLVRASAGTGKTFSIATRFIRLVLFDGVDPAHVVALTFSRAAAREIYAKILQRLWKAAATEDGAAEERKRLAGDLVEGLLSGAYEAEKNGERGKADDFRRKAAEVRKKDAGTDWSPANFARILRRVLDSQHVGAISTLDSFILRIVRNFPLELGFQHAVGVLDGEAETEAVDKAVRDVLGRTADTDGFVEAFRTARKGKLPRVLATSIDYMMKTEGWRKFLLSHPGSAGWNAASMAAALGTAGAKGFSDAGELALAPFLASLGKSPADKALAKFADHLVGLEAGGNPVPGKTSIAAEFARAVARHPRDPHVIHEKKTKGGTAEERYDYPQAVFDAARKDLSRLADAFLNRQLETVEAKLRLFSFIEGEYDAATRKAGKLTFADFTNYSAEAEKDPEKALAVQNLEFRFDSAFDHWALDEFQDTSEVQWTCLRRLVESAAEPDGARTVLAVGDLKQSIYRWRGGNDAPFKEMMGWESFRGKVVPLDVSRRYRKNICDFLNDVFGPGNVRDGGVLPPERSTAAERWLGPDCWGEHEPETGDDGKPKADDFVKVVSVRPEDGAADIEALLPALERELRPVWEAHELAKSDETVGILVRSNADGAAVAEFLRSKGFPVVWEGFAAVADVPVVKAVVHLLRLADHPEDSFAWTFVNDLLPVREILFPFPDADRGEAAGPAPVSGLVAAGLVRSGLARTLGEWCGKLCEDGNGLDALSKERLRALVRVGVDYERRNPDDFGVDGFVRFLEESRRRENGNSPRVVRVLTIHRSKGLTLDRVFVPVWETSGGSIAESGSGSALVHAPGKKWVLPRVPEDVVRLNETVRAAVEDQRDERLLDELRTRYVALTRARKAMYVFLADWGPGVRFANLVESAKDVRDFPKREEEGCVVLFERGTPPGFASPGESGKDGTFEWVHEGGMPPVRRSSPSTEGRSGRKSDDEFVSSSRFFAESAGEAAGHGIAEHAAYAQIGWIDPDAPKDDRERQILAWGGKWAEAFRKDPDATVWRERNYELFRPDGNVWETGKFDRVVFRGNGENRTAEIYDFKTNDNSEKTPEAFGEEMREAYAGQMAAYRRAISRLCGIRPEHVSSTLLLAVTGTAVTVDTVA